jgi:hypothetical protein
LEITRIKKEVFKENGGKIRPTQAGQDNEDLFERVAEHYHEEQSNKDKELSFTQDLNLNFKDSIRIREANKEFRVDFGEEAWRAKKIRRRA